MNILYITPLFPKEKEGTNLYTDLAVEMAKKHNVTVIVSEEKKKIKQTQMKEERGIKVLRVKVGNMYSVSLFEKGISFITMQHIMKKEIKNYLKDEKYDMILFMAPPVTLGSVVKYAMKKYHAMSYLMQKDIFPQNSLDLEIMSKSNPIYYYFKYKEKNMYKIATVIGCMSKKNVEYLIEKNPYLSKEKFEIFPNTIMLKEVKNSHTNIRKKYNISNEKILALYGGNFGKPQGIDFILKVLNKYKEDKRVVFFFSGKGTEKEKLYTYIRNNNLTNVITQEYIPREDYVDILKETDVGLIFLDYRFTIPNIPSRTLSYFEYSIPIMAATDKNTDYKDLIEQSESGLWCESNNIDEFTRKFDLLLENEDKRIQMGENGRRYLEKNLTTEKSVKILEKTYNRLKGGNKNV